MSESVATEERVVEGESPEKTFAEHAARYAFAGPFVRDRRTLDMACGSGYGSAMLRAAGATAVVGVDLSAPALEYGRKRYGNDAITFLQGDACSPPPMAPFDAIVSFETIEHLAEPERFLGACRDLLAPGGVFLVSSPFRHRMRPDGKPLNQFHLQEWRTDEFDALLRKFFDDVIIYGQCLKLESRIGLSRRLAYPLARLQGRRPGDPKDIYPLPGARFFGIWKPFPAYLIAICRHRSSGGGAERAKS